MTDIADLTIGELAAYIAEHLHSNGIETVSLTNYSIFTDGGSSPRPDQQHWRDFKRYMHDHNR